MTLVFSFFSMFQNACFLWFKLLRHILFMFLWILKASFLMQIVWFQKISIPPHGGSRKFQGVEWCERGKFPKGSGVYKELFFPEGLKCDGVNTCVLFPLIQGNQEKLKIQSVEINVRFLVIYFSLIFHRRTTQIALRDTM